MGGLIGNASYEKNGLISATVFTAILRGMGKEIYEITNADDIQHNGIYRFNASTSNEILGEKWGLLIHACPFDGVKSFAQIFISSNNRLIFRQTFDNTVGVWISVI